jgi:hypothetical protein
VQGESTREGKLKKLRFEWQRCAFSHSATYPKAAWTAFLKRYGIKEKHDNSLGE